MSEDIVADVSVSAAWVLRDESSPACEALLRSVLTQEFRLVLPELWNYEMLSVLRNAVVRRRGAQAQAIEAWAILQGIPATFVSADDQGRSTILTCALTHDLSAYDATYFHLAESLKLRLFTADSHLLQLQRGHPWILSVADIPGQEPE